MSDRTDPTPTPAAVGAEVTPSSQCDRPAHLAERLADLQAAAPPVIPPCPPWCVSAAELHRLEFDVDREAGTYSRTHEAYSSGVATVEAVETSDGHGGPVTLSAPRVVVYGADYDGRAVTADEAGALADQLRQAASVLARLSD